MPKPSLRSLTIVVLVGAALAACNNSASPEKQMAAAKAYLDKGDLRSATIELKSVLQVKPDNGEARLLLGKAYLDNDEPVPAAVELRKAGELKMPDEKVMPPLARALLDQGRAGEVVAQFSAATLREPVAQAALSTTLGQAYAMQNQLPKSEQAYARALEAQPGYAPAKVGQARLMAARGDTAAALAAVQEVTASGALDADAWALQGDLLVYTKADQTAALAAYRKALSVQAKHLGANAGAIALLLGAHDLDGARALVASLQKSRPAHPMTRFFSAQLAYEKQDYKSARELIAQLLKAVPEHPQANHLAGAIELAAGSPTIARAHLAKTLQAAPGNLSARRMMAAAMLRTGDAAKALDVLEPALSATPPDAASLALAGEAQMQLGQLDKASDFFARAAQADPANTNSQTALARTRFLKGDQAGALADLERIAAADKGATADLELANAQLRRKDYAGALKAIDNLERKIPGKALPWQLRGVAYQGLKDNAQARAAYEHALKAEASYFPAALNLARMDLTDNKMPAAQARFEALLKAQPGHLRAMLALADLKQRAAAAPQEVTDLLNNAVRLNPGEAAAHVALVNHLLQQKSNDAALGAAQKADAALPNQPMILDALGRAQLATGQQAQALATFNKIVAVQPKSVGAQLRVADANLLAKNSEQAIQGLRRAVAARPDSPVLVARLFALEVQAGHEAEALKLARDLQKSQPQHGMGFVMEGDLLRRDGKLDAALAQYRIALAKNMPSDAATRTHATLLALGKNGDAEQFASGWAKDHPNDLAFTLYQADGAMARRDFVQAEAAYRRVLEMSPNHAAALNNTAWLLAKAGKPGAVAMAERANQLQPHQAALMDTLAFALAAEKRLDQAIETQKKALALAPHSPTIQLGMARLYAMAGQKAQARELLEPLAKLGDAFSEQAEVKALLAAN